MVTSNVILDAQQEARIDQAHSENLGFSYLMDSEGNPIPGTSRQRYAGYDDNTPLGVATETQRFAFSPPIYVGHEDYIHHAESTETQHFAFSSPICVSDSASTCTRPGVSIETQHFAFSLPIYVSVDNTESTRLGLATETQHFAFSPPIYVDQNDYTRLQGDSTEKQHFTGKRKHVDSSSEELTMSEQIDGPLRKKYKYMSIACHRRAKADPSVPTRRGTKRKNNDESMLGLKPPTKISRKWAEEEEEPKCPATCVCITGRSTLSVEPTRRRLRVATPMCRLHLENRLMMDSNRFLYPCCENRCRSKGYKRGSNISDSNMDQLVLDCKRHCEKL